MSISERTRKLLWGRSGNICAICKRELVIDSNEIDDDSIIGEECHIISKKEKGPRYKAAENPDILDEYSNLILLCRVHHKLIDDQPNKYNVNYIMEIKKGHETWVKEKLEHGAIKPIRLRRIEDNKVEFLYRIVSAKGLCSIIDQACAYHVDNPEPENDSEVGLFGGFLQAVTDWGDIGGDLEPYDRVKATYDLANLLKEIEESGFWIFGNREKMILEGGASKACSWPVAYITIVRNDSPLIIHLSTENGEIKKA